VDERRGQFERHLREAIALNRARAPRYAAISGGASTRISAVLIATEVMLVVVARWFDRAAGPYHRAGVPLLETLFEPMSAAPQFVAHRPWPSTAESANVVDVAANRRDVERALREGGFAGAAAALASELAQLEPRSQADCLVRHLLESARRLTVEAPSHVALAEERGLESPAPLLTRLLGLHLRGLGAAARLDRWARPLQMQGVAILAQDLPAIPAIPAPVSQASLSPRQT
jgi:hypothetical protein